MPTRIDSVFKKDETGGRSFVSTSNRALDRRYGIYKEFEVSLFTALHLCQSFLQAQVSEAQVSDAPLHVDRQLVI